MGTLAPVVKISEAKYLVGTEVKWLEMQFKVLKVRKSDGLYETLDSYLRSTGAKQCLKFFNLIEDSKNNMVGVIEGMLRRFGAKDRALTKFVRNFNVEQERLFMHTLAAYKQKQIKLQSIRGAKKLTGNKAFTQSHASLTGYYINNN